MQTEEVAAELETPEDGWLAGWLAGYPSRTCGARTASGASADGQAAAQGGVRCAAVEARTRLHRVFGTRGGKRRRRWAGCRCRSAVRCRRPAAKLRGSGQGARSSRPRPAALRPRTVLASPLARATAAEGSGPLASSSSPSRGLTHSSRPRCSCRQSLSGCPCDTKHCMPEAW